MSFVRVLVADDDPTIRTFLARHLQGHGYDVVCVDDGAAACVELELGNFDFCILDWNMPIFSGIKVCQWLRTQPAHARTKVIFVTSCKSAEEIQCAYDAGADHYVTKPFKAYEISVALAPDQLSVQC